MLPTWFHVLCSASSPSYSGVFVYRLYLPGSPSHVHYQYISTTPVYSYSLDLILLLLYLAISCPLNSCAFLDFVSCLVCCALGAPTSDFNPSQPLTLRNSLRVLATLPSTLRTQLGLRSAPLSHTHASHWSGQCVTVR